MVRRKSLWARGPIKEDIGFVFGLCVFRTHHGFMGSPRPLYHSKRHLLHGTPWNQRFVEGKMGGGQMERRHLWAEGIKSSKGEFARGWKSPGKETNPWSPVSAPLGGSPWFQSRRGPAVKRSPSSSSSFFNANAASIGSLLKLFRPEEQKDLDLSKPREMVVEVNPSLNCGPEQGTMH